MKTKIVLSLISIFSVLTISLDAQSWSYGSGKAYIYPTTTKVGIGTNNPINSLTVYNSGVRAITCRIVGDYPPISTGTSTNYYKQLEVEGLKYNIPSETTDNGYRIGLAVQGFVHSDDFSGILRQQVAAWIRAGSYSSAPTGTIKQSIALFVDNLTSSNVTIEESFGIFQSSTSAKNYFAGNVGIGTATPDYKLEVNGTIRAKEVLVETGWSDFVFEDDYVLPTLEDVEAHIKENGHLPEIPSAKEVAANGISVGEMNAKLLQKIEELTLYVIEQQKRIEELESRVAE